MKVYLISYELTVYSRRMNQLHSVIKDCAYKDKWVQCFNNLWIIRTEMSKDEIYDKLKAVFCDSNCFIIIGVTPDCDGWIDTSLWDYLNNKIFKD